MKDIHHRAACTIAATATKDSDGGLFRNRDPILVQPLQLETTWAARPNGMDDNTFAYPPAGNYACGTEELWAEAVERQPLNSRAWVCQERHLSTQIMHFSNDQLFWECHENSTSENYPRNLPSWTMPYWFNDGSLLRRQLHELNVLGSDLSSGVSQVADNTVAEHRKILLEEELYFSWAVFRIRYTECQLTKGEDKLVVI